MQLVTENLITDWQIECRQYDHLFQGQPEPGSQETVIWLMDEIDRLRGTRSSAALKSMTVSASAVRVAPDQTLLTRLARLSPITNALADSDQQMSVMVMDDKSIYIGALDGKTPVVGAEITVSGEGVAEKTMKTDGSGYIELPMRNYPSDRDGEAKVNIKVSRDGYRGLEANGVYIKKGSIFKVSTAQDDGTPYPISWTFWGNDMYLSQYELLISPYNDSSQEIAMKVSSGQNYTLTMYFTDSKGGNRLNVGTANGKPGTETHTFSGQWLKNAPADGKLYAEITPQGGSTMPYQAMIKLIAPKLKAAIGDPNFKLLTTPGLQFTLPSKWPKPLSGLTIATLKTKEGIAPTHISLGGNDTGYYMLTDQNDHVSVYRFNFQLVPGIRLVGNVLTETLVTPGVYDDMILTLYNNGNIPLSGLDLIAYDQKKDGSAEAFEIIHLDVLHPENNRVTLKKGLEGNTWERDSWAVARQEESSLNPEGTNYWLVTESRYMGSTTARLQSKKTTLKKTELIMPGTFAAFNISLLLPNSWTSSHTIYLQVDKYYTTADNSFSGDASSNGQRRVAAEPEIVSIGRDGTVQSESGAVPQGAASGAADQADYSMFKTDLAFDAIGLSSDTSDLEIVSRRWSLSDGTPMVTLTVTNQRYVAQGERRSNAVVMEAFLDEETTPVFRYSLPDEVSDTETWNFDLPLSLLTDGRSAGKVTVKVGGRNYVENGEFDNSVVIYLEPETMTIRTQPQDQAVAEGGGAEFSVAVSGGRTPLKYQWQVKTAGGTTWADLPGETAASLTLQAVALDMSGNQYRVIVTDASGCSLTSRAASLTVKKVPHTGDDAPVVWWIVGTALALAGIAYVIISRKKEQHEKLCNLLIVFLCFMFLCPALAEETDPVVVRVGKVEYPLSIARYSYQSNLDLMAYQGYTPTVAEREELKQQTVDHLVDLALIENKLIEAGKNNLTDAEQTLLRSYAGNVYESLWQGFQQRVKNEGYDASEEQITQWLSEQGYTLDVVYQEALVNVRYSHIFQLYCPDVSVTDEDIEAYLQNAFVEPDREAYENDIPRYEQEILNAGNEAFFTPAGYRIIRQILLPYPQSVVNEINALQPALEDGAALLDEMYKAVADAVLAGGDIDAAREAYQAQADAYAELLGQVVELEESALPMVKETTDEIARRCAAGESFESLIAEYGKEAGADAGQELLFHPDSEAWAEAFRQQVSVLEKPGDITAPFVTNLGIHIVRYQGDLPSGVHELTQEEREALAESALQNKQLEALRSFLDTWKTQYSIETHPEML